ncbi:MAG: hypothetical protein M0C28_40145 [Candidatus Moduliflexus flocculans]|nr:hypothetical protein [Candidatus Moduliflexus flocculans]
MLERQGPHASEPRRRTAYVRLARRRRSEHAGAAPQGHRSQPRSTHRPGRRVDPGRPLRKRPTSPSSPSSLRGTNSASTSAASATGWRISPPITTGPSIRPLPTGGSPRPPTGLRASPSPRATRSSTSPAAACAGRRSSTG